MFVKKGVDFLPRISLKELEKFYNEEKNAKARIRLQCAILRKARIRLNIKHTKVRRQRENSHKKLARNLAREIEYIGVESLNIQGMVRNHCLAKSISDCGRGSFFSYLKYYKTIFGGEMIGVGRFEPTTQTCSDCGHRQDMLLENRIFECGECGMIKDKDLNASINIRRLTINKLIERGIKLNTEGHSGIYAHGDNVRPIVFEQEAVVEEVGTIRDEVVICNQ